MLFQRYERAKRAKVRQAFVDADMGWLTDRAVRGRPVFVGMPNCLQYGFLASVGRLTDVTGINFELMMLPIKYY